MSNDKPQQKGADRPEDRDHHDPAQQQGDADPGFAQRAQQALSELQANQRQLYDAGNLNASARDLAKDLQGKIDSITRYLTSDPSENDRKLKDGARQALEEYGKGLKSSFDSFYKEYSQKPGKVLDDYVKGVTEYLTTDYNKNDRMIYANAAKSLDDFQKNPAHWLGEHTPDIAAHALHEIGPKGAGAMKEVAREELQEARTLAKIEKVESAATTVKETPRLTPETPPKQWFDEVPRRRPGDLREPRTKDFSTPREVNLDELSETENKAFPALRKQEWEVAKCEQVLSSGEPSSFKVRTIKQGEEFYRFDSKARLDADKSKMANPSAYWMDKETYDSLAREFYDAKSQSWNQEGLKSRLALPCYNKADCVVKGTAAHATDGVASKIGPATESTYYYDANNRVAIRHRGLEGGGEQISLDPKEVQVQTHSYHWSRK